MTGAERKRLNMELYPRVQAGDTDAVRSMIENNVPYVHWKVASFLKQWPTYEYLADELISAGYDRVVASVNALVGTSHEEPNPTAYISTAIFRSISQTIRNLPGNGVATKSGPTTKIFPLKPHRCGKRALDSNLNQLELFDEILGCCHSDVERQVIRLRADGNTDREVASILGTALGYVNEIRAAIYARFKERNDEYA
jgi:hypothetical protein